MSSEMPDGWRLRAIGELTDNHDARRVPVREQDRVPGPHPYYGASGVVDHVNDYLFEGLHLLVAEDGENLLSRKLPVAFLADGQFWVNNHAHVLTGKQLIADTRFLSNALEASDISAYVSGSAQPKLNKASLSRIAIPAPPFPEQRRIAGVLGALEAKIEANRRLHKSAQDLPDGFFDELLGEVAERKPLADLVCVQKESVSPADKPDELFEHFSIPAFDAGGVAVIEPGSEMLSAKTRIPATGDTILLSKLNPATPRIWWPRPSREHVAVCSSEFIAVQPRDGFPASFVYASLRRDRALYDEILSHVSGTTGSRQRVKPVDVLGCGALAASRDQLARFDAIARLLYETAHAALGENRRLGAIRDALLPKLASGQIRVPESYDPDDGVGTVERAATR